MTEPVPAVVEPVHAADLAGTGAPLLAVRGVTKEFPGTLALDHVDFELRAGEIHALVGENGAGKSTLIKILAGVYRADSGVIEIRDQPLASLEHAPISFIHQDLGLVGSMTVAENIALVAGYARRGARLIDWRAVRARATHLLAEVGSTADPDAPVASLASADRSLVAIARALAVEADVLVLDEPTASLPEADVRRLFDSLRRLRARGMGIVFVTHRLDEVFRLADRLTVIRDGRNVSTRRVADTTPGALVFQIVGRRLSELFISPSPAGEAVLLELRDLRLPAHVGPVSLQVHTGEIVGLVGLRGAGQDLVGRAICGAGDAWSGTLRFLDAALAPRAPAAAIRSGLGFVSSRRAEESLAGMLTVRENVYPNPLQLGMPLLRPLSHRNERRRIARALERYNIRPRDPERLVSTLSGGNQQKAVLARWMEARSRLLVLEEPTIGVDVGSKAEIYRLLAQEVSSGS
ncbi:MAG: sugar ABC transporter ATP-binding protein, partial [Chloroflexi bacterium]|nr:sugar ABC transporter ATP-binding protein [Chloroflexota bacterium]